MASELKAGDAAPEFSLPTMRGQRTLGDYRGRYLVLYFYPKDDTPGCTQEALEFNELADAFIALGAELLGVSRDPLPKHEKFAAKHALTFLLGSDEDGHVSQAYGTWVEKSMYGRSYMGMARATFLINPDGVISRVWPKVRVKGHAQEVLSEITSHARPET